ncbi:NAD(P)/FAD-dependent oxidoreductase [Pseudoroseicyclus aestuarii]|uniref:Glycine/D-amino acid oxidase-like deaminating enzyme n=1 Tax=Pseudoroseicyclus aestuarii TaxID=1795041 RepID=A0A318SYY0_9RHOB|nr:FAD-dependent oxidoreductase [Pseudoroseicyclus aestuarii]PYE85606.1 glycine/D-amino acid oxidase-like deaminating enzyme [Pseudoroseicyclus aestuarii]
MTDCIVLGAGMVGVSTALALQARGWSVALVDRRAPGQETSHGNAGIIQTEAAEPYAMPLALRSLARIALGRDNDVAYSLRGLLGMAPALARYARASRASGRAARGAVYSALTARAAQDHAPLIEAAGAEALIAQQGYLEVYRYPKAFAAGQAEAERLGAAYGVPSRPLDGAALAAREPALRIPMAGALHWTGPWTCSDPGGLVAAYARLFEARGGQLLTGDAASLTRAGSGWQVTTPEGRIEAPRGVVALGPWSPLLLRGFGLRVPMILKRGYHGHFAAPVMPRLPLVMADHGLVLSPMRAGLRLATGAALVGHAEASAPLQLHRGAKAVADAIDLGPRVQEAQWHGTRPCLPDMLPVLGEAPGQPGLWLHFGHGHQGFTLGPTTAALLAEAMAGGKGVPEALSPGRPGLLA